MCEVRLKTIPYTPIIFNPDVIPLKKKNKKPCDNPKCEEDNCCK